MMRKIKTSDILTELLLRRVSKKVINYFCSLDKELDLLLKQWIKEKRVIRKKHFYVINSKEMIKEEVYRFVKNWMIPKFAKYIYINNHEIVVTYRKLDKIMKEKGYTLEEVKEAISLYLDGISKGNKLKLPNCFIMKDNKSELSYYIFLIREHKKKTLK